MKNHLIIFALIFAGFSTANALPNINFSISPSSGVQNTEFTIDGRDSLNSSGNMGGVDFRCQYFYGEEWTKWSARLTLKFKTEKIGNHRAKCQARDRETGLIQSTYRDFQVKKDSLRRVRIEASKLNLSVGEPVFFSLVIPRIAGENPDTILSRWDFNSDGIWDTKFTRKKVISHVYDKSGQLTPTVEVKFPNGRIFKTRGLAPKRDGDSREYDFSGQKIRISAKNLFAPIVNISPGTAGFNENTVFKIDASKSRVPRLGWLEFSIDGQQWKRFPRKKIASVKFGSPGKHEVRSRVCIGKKNLECAETKTSFDVKRDPLDFSVKIMLQNRTNPIISRDLTDRNIGHYVPVEVGDKVRFSALAVRYGNLGQVLYRWDFNSDGKWDTSFSRNNFTETNFDHLGEFKVTVEVQSEDGIIVQQSKKVLVEINPKSTIYIEQNPAKLFVGEKVRFIPRYPSGFGDQIRFDIDNDGFWESDFRGLGSQEWIFKTSGEKTVKMQSRDKGGNITTINKKVFVENLPDVKARVIVSKKYIQAGEAVIFDAIDSSGRNLRYFWDFNSSGGLETGNWEENRPMASKVSRVFQEVGEKIISLKVIDETGKGDQIFFPVIIQ